jgi:hypothetical protein
MHGTISEASRQVGARADRAPQPYIRSISLRSHHDAIIRIGGELRGGGSILDSGMKAMDGVHRITATSDCHRQAHHMVVAELLRSFLIPFPFEFSVMPDAEQCHPTIRLL